MISFLSILSIIASVYADEEDEEVFEDVPAPDLTNTFHILSAMLERGDSSGILSMFSHAENPRSSIELFIRQYCDGINIKYNDSDAVSHQVGDTLRMNAVHSICGLAENVIKLLKAVDSYYSNLSRYETRDVAMCAPGAPHVIDFIKCGSYSRMYQTIVASLSLRYVDYSGWRQLFKDDSYLDWIKSGCFDPKVAKKLISLGISPEELEFPYSIVTSDYSYGTAASYLAGAKTDVNNDKKQRMYEIVLMKRALNDLYWTGIVTSNFYLDDLLNPAFMLGKEPYLVSYPLNPGGKLVTQVLMYFPGYMGDGDIVKGKRSLGRNVTKVEKIEYGPVGKF